MLNLLAFWLGGMATGIGAAMVVLVLLRDFASTAMQDMVSMAGSVVASSTGRQVQIAFGVLALLIAALIAVGFSVPKQARAPMPGGEPSALLLPSTATAFSRLLARTKDGLGARFPWVALMAGLSSAGPPPIEYMVALTAILASGAAIGTQLSAVVAFMVVMLAMVEIPLVSYLAKPAKTEAVVLLMRDWLRARSRQILAVGVAVIGVVLLSSAMGSA
jgi:hypothetical protein